MDKTDLSMDKSVDKLFSSNVLESSILVIVYDKMDNLFYPNEGKKLLYVRSILEK